MGGGFLRALLWVVAIVLYIVFAFVGILGSGSITPTATRTTTTTATTTKGSYKHLEVMERERPDFHPDLDPNNMSKRRVPNGPDPIHNRYTGTYHVS